MSKPIKNMLIIEKQWQSRLFFFLKDKSKIKIDYFEASHWGEDDDH